MPEGPEVRTVAESLNNRIKNYTLTSIEWNEKSKYGGDDREGFPYYNIIELILPAVINEIICKGKRLIFNLTFDDEINFYITSHLGMEGHWMWKSGSNTGLWFNLLSPDGDKITLFYDDARHLGNFRLFLKTDLLENYLITEHGPDLLAYSIWKHDNSRHDLMKIFGNVDITPELWKSKIKNKRIKNKEIADFLMTQKYFCGIGNYLKSEILYRAKIRPNRVVSDLTDQEIETLRVVALDTIYQSYLSGGLTINSYFDPDGNKGVFRCLVYEKSHDEHGHQVIKSMFKDKRTTHWVKEIQI